MTTLCNNNNNKIRNKNQLNFLFYKKKITTNFNGGSISTDGGLLLIKEFDNRIGYLKSVSQCIVDTRNPIFVTHEINQLVNQRIYQIIAGYEDAVDCNRLKDDGIIKLVSGKKLDEPASSQPTMSRLENRVTEEDNEKLNTQLIKNFINSRKKKLKKITLEIDSTDDPAYGNQQLTLFNAYYGQNMYHPLLIHDRKTGAVLSIKLRAGNEYTSTGVVEMLEKVVKELKTSFNSIKIKVVADSGFSKPELYRYCEEEGIKYLIVIKSNAVINNKIEEKIKGNKTVVRIKSGEKKFYYTSIKYRSKSWKKQRRIIIKIGHNETNDLNIRKIVTNMSGCGDKLYKEYGKRGEQENRIKELKNGFKADRLSCKKFLANEFRLILFTHAYNLVVLFREQLKGTSLAKAQIDTLRIKLIKVGVLIKESTRRVCVYLSSGWPYKNLYMEVKHLLERVNIPVLSTG